MCANSITLKQAAKRRSIHVGIHPLMKTNSAKLIININRNRSRSSDINPESSIGLPVNILIRILKLTQTLKPTRSDNHLIVIIKIIRRQSGRSREATATAVK